MKILRLTILTLVLMAGVISVQAQKQTRQQKQAAKEAAVKAMIDAQSFTFNAQQMNPMRGGMINLTSSYDVRVVKDSVISYLPYFGRAYVAPMNPTDNAMQFTSTKFGYNVVTKKNGIKEITIKPTDTKDVRQMLFSIAPNGYGTLSVTNLNRDPVSFYGYVEASKKTAGQ